MRIVAWNIRAGGGLRVAAIARQLERWAPDVVALSEFRATPPSRTLADALDAAGLPHQLTTADPRSPGVNALLVAARWPLGRVRLDAFRHLRAEQRAYTWYSPNGRNGFRIDQAFVNAPLLARLKDAAYVWGGAWRGRRRDALSDHAALLLDLADAP